MKPTHSEVEAAVLRAVQSWPVISAVALMVANDHLLKGNLPGLVTGKLSDVAFMFFAPIVLAYVARARCWRGVAICAAVPAALFAAINLSQWASVCFAEAMSLVFPMVLWPDPTDLVALVSVPAALGFLRSLESDAPWGHGGHRWQLVVAGAAAVACLATSPRPIPATHQPVYMSYEDLRATAGQVLPPQPIAKSGKIVVHGDTLFVSDTGRGIHVIDNSDPSSPRPVLFLKIPGNVDIALEGNVLYADCFVDLLVFELDLENNDAVLVQRLTDHFEYDPYQALGHDSGVRFERVQPERGVVIGAEPHNGEVVTPSAIRVEETQP